MNKVKYLIRYFWDDEYHTVEVVTSSGETTARLLALDVAKSRDHYPYGELKIMETENVTD